MDIFVLKAVADDLRQRLRGAIVSKVFQMNPDDLLLRLWRQQDIRLLLSTDVQWPRLHLTTERFHNPARPPRFAALLRAHLQHVRLLDITVHPYERRLALLWGDPSDLQPTLTLVQELQSTRSNLVLLDAQGIIIDALKHMPEEKHRAPLLPGQPYQPIPLPPGRIPWSSLSVADLTHLQQQGQLDATSLQRLVVGLSRSMAAELAHRSQYDMQQAGELLHTLQEQYASGTLTLSIHTRPTGERLLSAVPLTYCAGSNTAFASAHDAVATFYQTVSSTARLEHKRQEVQRVVTQRLQKLRKKIMHLHQDEHKLQGYLSYQHYGTLLVTQRLARGATSATVVDYYSPEQVTVQIPLDPRLSVYDNAQAYFKKYRKAKNGLGTIQIFLTQCSEAEERLQSLLQRTMQATHWHELETIASAVEGFLARPQRHTSSTAPAPVATAVPYRTFALTEGYTLYCGKSDQGNDALLRRVATAEDIWLHAYQQAGAHAILKVQAPHDVPEHVLQEAAAVAAFYSKGKQAASVEVLYTRAKYVRKMRGARPGQVQVSEYRTITVTPQLPTTVRT